MTINAKPRDVTASRVSRATPSGTSSRCKPHVGAFRARLHGGLTPRSEAPYISLAFLNGRLLYISPDGHYRGPERIEEDLVYVVLTEEGQQLTLSPQEFSAKYGWQNDPQRVGKAP